MKNTLESTKLDVEGFALIGACIVRFNQIFAILSVFIKLKDPEKELNKLFAGTGDNMVKKIKSNYGEELANEFEKLKNDRNKIAHGLLFSNKELNGIFYIHKDKHGTETNIDREFTADFLKNCDSFFVKTITTCGTQNTQIASLVVETWNETVENMKEQK
ncbi:MAG: hypothetical protein LBG64_01145 [Pseudomonadales bacterium]|nr:hypothetical protein [Pseudomonadales bacterium]